MLRRSPRLLGSLALIAALVGLLCASSAFATAPTIDLDEIQPGQRGYGLSVFSGTEPARFEAEVVGVMRNVSPGVSYILARLSGHGLEKSGVAAGMSGSPVYFDDRLAGAVAFSWSFSQGAIAGITPIELMREIPAQGLPSEAPIKAAAGSLAWSWRDLATGDLPTDLLEKELSRFLGPMALGRTPFGEARTGLQWAFSGFGELGGGVLQRSLGSAAPAGRSRASAPIVPGGAVAAVLIEGDLTLAANATVTDVDGEDVLAFGHAFLGAGALDMPLATSEVVMVLSSLSSSFKISNVGPVVGTFSQDRQAGIRGRVGPAPEMIPLRLRMRSGDEPLDEYNVRLAPIPALTPALVSLSVLGALEASSYQNGLQGLDITARFRLADYEDLEIEQSFDGGSAVAEASTLVLAFGGFLIQNAFEEIEVESIEIDVSQWPEPRTASLVAAHADRSVVAPGDTVRLFLETTPFRGETERRTLTFEVPEHLNDGKLYLFVGDGPSVDVARFTLEKAEPTNLDQALERLRAYRSKRDLALLAAVEGAGLAAGGELLPELPPSMRSLWGAAGTTASASGVRLKIVADETVASEVPIEGVARIDLQVSRKAAGTGARPTPTGSLSKESR
ncbi:MAG: hypothetical protein AAF481_17625 [Acidobacteriota bacterium]